MERPYGHIDSTLIAGVAPGAVIAFVCGSDGFVETASRLLIETGFAAERIRTERFGGSGVALDAVRRGA